MFKKVKEIKSKTGIVHFTRWLIFCIPKKNINLYLHRITHADEEGLFDIPQKVISLTLSGKFVERVKDKIYVRNPLNIKYKKSSDRCRILHLISKKVYSLNFTFK